MNSKSNDPLYRSQVSNIEYVVRVIFDPTFSDVHFRVGCGSSWVTRPDRMPSQTRSGDSMAIRNEMLVFVEIRTRVTWQDPVY